MEGRLMFGGKHERGAMGDYMNFLFNPNGRVSRKDIWLKFWLVSIIAGTVTSAIDAAIFPAGVGILNGLTTLFFFWPGIAVSIKRFHDRGMSGWWAGLVYLGMIVGIILIVIPLMPSFTDAFAGQTPEDAEIVAAFSGGNSTLMIVGALVAFGAGLFAFIVNYCLAGETGHNKYGPDPLNPDGGAIDVFN